MMTATKKEIKAVGRGSLMQQARLWTGLIMFAYVLGHFTNHALGLFSFSAMNAMLSLMSLIWGSTPGGILLYSAFGFHILFGFIAILSIRTWRMPFWRWLQILLGLAIPYFLITHIIVTRGTELTTGLPVTYMQEFVLLWPAAAIKQNALLLIVWTHAMIGFHFWLRPYGWYRDGCILLIPLAFSLPIMAIAGWITAARRELARVGLEPSSEEAVELAIMVEKARGVVGAYGPDAQTGVLVAIGALPTLLIGLFIARNFSAKLRVTYGNETEVRATKGTTILDVSRGNNIPHMSVCGGRARCSTCRVMVMSDGGGLSPIKAAERKLLDSIKAEPNVRLACQARVTGDVEIRPLIHPRKPNATSTVSDTLGWGVERPVTVFHLKIIDFLSLIDRSLPYDAVFILNHFLDQMVSEIEQQGGQIDKFTSDGLIALFGLESTREDAVRSALTAAVNCHNYSLQSDDVLVQHLDDPIKVGIGIHSDKALVGRIGKRSGDGPQSALTAIGNVSGIAEAFAKVTEKLDACIIYSEAAHEVSKVGKVEMIGKRGRIRVEGISDEMEAIILKKSGYLRKLLQNTI